jgi:hypothetical protein
MTSCSHSSTTNELKGELVEIRINPEYQKLVPPMTKEAFESLVSSIRANGLHEPSMRSMFVLTQFCSVRIMLPPSLSIMVEAIRRKRR